MSVGKRIRNLLLGLAGLVLVLLVALQVVLRPRVLTGMVNRLAAEYVDGQVSFREVRAHVLKSFPYLNVEAQDFAITYPHGRYQHYDSLYTDAGRRFSLLKAGRGEEQDTLASFQKLSVSLDYMAFLEGREIRIHRLEMEHPRVFAHSYGTEANWDILPLGKQDSTREKKPLPPLEVSGLRMVGRPMVVYTNPADTLHLLFTLRRLALDGKLRTDAWDKARAGLALDSVLVSGRMPRDTVLLRLERLRLQADNRQVHLDLEASSRLATQNFGRLRVPLKVEADARIPERADTALEVNVERLALELASIGLEGKGTVVKWPEAWDLDVQALIDDCPLGQVIRQYRDNIPFFKKIDTDARLHLSASASGRLGEGQTPSVEARVKIPLAGIDYEGLGRKGRLALEGTVSTNDLKEVNARVDRLLVELMGGHLDASARIGDLLGKDPLISLDGTVNARVDSLTQAFTREQGITGTGRIDARLQGKARLSQLNPKQIGAATVQCSLDASTLSLERAADSLHARVPHLQMELSTRANQIDRNLKKGARVLALKGQCDSLDLTRGNLFVRGTDVQLLMQNSADILKGGKDLTSLMGLLKMKRLRLRDADGVSLDLQQNTEYFRITPSGEQQAVPKLSLRTENSRVDLRQRHNSYTLFGLKLDLSAARHQRRQLTSADSLAFRARQNARPQPRRQDDFAGKDIRISLSDQLKDYFRNWDFEGKLQLGSGRLRTPSFPLSTSLSKVEGRLNNDTLELKQLGLKAGTSQLQASGRLSGLRRAVLGRGRGTLKLKADVQSNFLNANELLRAYAYYQQYTPSAAPDGDAEVSLEQLPDSLGSPLIVIPANLEVELSVESTGIRYNDLLVNWAAADVAMRQRTLQITNAVAASNMGDIYFEGFYATRSKQDIQAGFDLNLVDITAEKVIALFPAVDSIMPMLKSFAGDLDCELAATADVDTCMNLVLPSVDGIMRISGKDLRLKDSQEFSKMAKLLMFKNSEEARIDNMSVSGMVRDNVLEVFPFILDIDRYLFAASGVQHLDQPFNYHISVVRSPLLVKFGLNAWGPDFDHIHYKLGQPKYRSTQVPVYTRQLDTVQMNLVAAIHNVFELGVEKALQEHRNQPYLQVDAAQLTDADAQEDSQVLDQLRNRERMMGDVRQRVAARLDLLRAQVLQLAEEAARKNPPPDDEL